MNTKPVKESIQTDPVMPNQIFYKFDSLLPGNGFIINEDNDPHSIYSQMLKEKGDTFSWEYLDVGPKKWCVKISKREKDDLHETLGELAVSDYRKALLLRKYGLDFSFKGKTTLTEACAEKDISLTGLQIELEACVHQSLVYTVNYNSWELDYLTDFIVTNHHQYTRRTLLSIADELKKNSKDIKQRHTCLLSLMDVFNQLNTTMSYIMQQEEQVLFPYIRFLVQVRRGKIVSSALPLESIQHHISKIESEHKKAGEQINSICNFTNNYTKTVIKDSFYTQVIQWLQELDNDIHQHVHIETNILFPKALSLEKEYIANAQVSDINSCKNSSINKNHSTLL